MQAHPYHDLDHFMYIVVGHSAALSIVMKDALDKEITRGLWWFYLSLLGGCAICFLIFSFVTERHLQAKVSEPIN